MNKPSSNSHQASLFGELGTMLKSKHPLLRLAQMVDWSLIEQSFTPHFCADKGRLPQPIRLMTGGADLTLKESIRINLAIEDRKKVMIPDIPCAISNMYTYGFVRSFLKLYYFLSEDAKLESRSLTNHQQQDNDTSYNFSHTSG